MLHRLCMEIWVIAVLISIFVVGIEGHTRLECPPPRSGNTGTKTGPCDAPDDLSLSAFPLQANAINTITWLESIPHPGAPLRLALSLDNNDDDVEGFESCILLDHIPHDEYSAPTYRDEATYHRSSISIYVPDIYCERCHLQLISVMSDEGHGVPVNTTCVYRGAQVAGTATDPSLNACPAVYHSCAPVSINGTTPRNTIDKCDTQEFEQRLDWPFNPRKLLSGGGPIVNCNSMSYCDPEQHYQEMIPIPSNAAYTQLQGACAAMVDMQVEPFALGVLPNTPKQTVGTSDSSESTVTSEEGLGDRANNVQVGDTASATNDAGVIVSADGTASETEEDGSFNKNPSSTGHGDAEKDTVSTSESTATAAATASEGVTTETNDSTTTESSAGSNVMNRFRSTKSISLSAFLVLGYITCCVI